MGSIECNFSYIIQLLSECFNFEDCNMICKLGVHVKVLCHSTFINDMFLTRAWGALSLDRSAIRLKIEETSVGLLDFASPDVSDDETEDIVPGFSSPCVAN